MIIIEIEHFDEGKEQLVRVPLANSDKQAILFEADFDDLISLGVYPPWKLYQGHIVSRNNGRVIAIGRLIRHAEAGQRVDTKDGDPCNLRRSNLVISPGPSKYAARGDLVRPYKSKIELQHTYEAVA